MGRVLLILAVLAAAPAPAQEPEGETLPDILEEGGRALLEQLFERLAPGFRALEDMLDEIDAYHPPEVLPNGDIIIRRKQPVPEDLEANPDGTVDL